MTKIALITGASRGLGAALAVALAPTHHIVAVGRTTGALEDMDDRVKAVGGQATLAPMDITKEDAMAHLCRGIHDRWGHADLWLHTAVHAAPLSPAGHLAVKDFDKSVAINLTATQRLIPMVEPLLRAAPEGGHAVFFEDDRAGEKFFGSYGATKAAQIALARSWQAETMNTGPKVSILSPRPLATALRSKFYPGEDRAALVPPNEEAGRLLALIL